EEVVFRVQGYITRVNLPPITREEQLTKNPSTAKQSLILTGLGCKEFDNSVRAVIEIHSKFASHLPVNSLQPWKPIVDNEQLCLEFANRYFTADYLASKYQTVSLNSMIDPIGLLTAQTKGDRHTEDNEVLYFEKITNDDGARYVSCNPIVFKPGILAEIQALLSVVPISKGRFLMLCKLRSVCLISRQTFESLKTPPKNDRKRLKRKVGYEGPNEEESTDQAMKKLKITAEQSNVMVTDK
ncbi:hypothetical protein BDY19DRAFT_899792, partial [Irpex rosettiformis]